jgi:hypothetical protein
MQDQRVIPEQMNQGVWCDWPSQNCLKLSEKFILSVSWIDMISEPHITKKFKFFQS